jgi:hypothetical protein
MENEWLEFEKLTAKVYSIINENGNGIVKHNDSIKGINSNRNRQIDVSIRYLLPGSHSILIIISCKNYKKKPNIRLIDEFVGLLQDIKANKGILICKSGFGDSILEYAKNRSIDLCTLEDLNNKNVLDDIRIPISYYNFDYNFTFGYSIEKNSISDKLPTIDFKAKFFTFDKKYFFSLAEYIFEFWKIKKLDLKTEAFKDTEIIPNIFLKDGDKYYSFWDFQIIYEKLLKIKYLLFEPIEYYKIKHFTQNNESVVFGFNNDLFDFNNDIWQTEKPIDFENELFYGNFFFLTTNEELTMEILNQYENN